MSDEMIDFLASLNPEQLEKLRRCYEEFENGDVTDELLRCLIKCHVYSWPNPVN